MKLATYLAAHEITYAAFAETIGVSVFAVSKYARGKRVPRASIMARIKAASAGAVTADDFCEPANDLAPNPVEGAA